MISIRCVIIALSYRVLWAVFSHSFIVEFKSFVCLIWSYLVMLKLPIYSKASLEMASLMSQGSPEASVQNLSSMSDLNDATSTATVVTFLLCGKLSSKVHYIFCPFYFGTAKYN